MGCYIHGVLQIRKKDQEWHKAYINFSLGRDYLMFSLLAGVRGYSSNVVPKGLPVDCDPPEEFIMYVDDELAEAGREKYCSKAEAKLWREPISKDSWGREYIHDPDYHSDSYMNYEQYAKTLGKYSNQIKKLYPQLVGEGRGSLKCGVEYEILLNAMKIYEKRGYETRFVFCFDN